MLLNLGVVFDFEFTVMLGILFIVICFVRTVIMHALQFSLTIV